MKIIFVFVLLACSLYPQSTVNDFDGNTYNTVSIGSQVWLRENLKSLHYSDGTDIPGTVGYNNSDSLINIYGRLYTWDAAMRNTTTQGAQGVCPAGWHVPSDAEWTALENFLGGAGVAGGKMKEAGTAHWNTPNTGGDNSSGFTALPGGEYDDYYSPHQFRLLNEYAVLWTSTEITSTKARERYIAFNSAASSVYDWFKVMKYSIRCIKNSAVGTDEVYQKTGDTRLPGNYPNPFFDNTTLSVIAEREGTADLSVFNSAGQEIKAMQGISCSAGKNEIVISLEGHPAGAYLYLVKINGLRYSGKILFVK